MLPGGNYALLVEAADAWGRITSTKQNFSVAYPWYASFWTKLIYLGSLLLLIAASVRLGQKLQNKALEQQNQNLELGISLRTKQIADKVDHLKPC